MMYKLSRRLLESIENALLLQVVEDPTRNCVAWPPTDTQGKALMEM